MEDMNMIPMCSVCDTELEYTEFVFDGCDGDTVWYESHGYCPECGGNIVGTINITSSA